MPLEKWIPTADRNGQKSPSSKAAALLARGAYSQYVSTAQGRERRWRIFSTFPYKMVGLWEMGRTRADGVSGGIAREIQGLL
jgi:hypothetical protein